MNISERTKNDYGWYLTFSDEDGTIISTFYSENPKDSILALGWSGSLSIEDSLRLFAKHLSMWGPKECEDPGFVQINDYGINQTGRIQVVTDTFLEIASDEGAVDQLGIPPNSDYLTYSRRDGAPLLGDEGIEPANFTVATSPKIIPYASIVLEGAQALSNPGIYLDGISDLIMSSSRSPLDKSNLVGMVNQLFTNVSQYHS